MNYKINPLKLTSAFMLPAELTEKHLKLIGEIPLKVMLWVYKNAGFDPIKKKKISKALKISESDVGDSLGFLAELGYLNADALNAKELNTGVNSALGVAENEEKNAVLKNKKPTREDILNLAANDENVKFILAEAQTKFGRLLRQNEIATLVWLYADEGMDTAVLLMAIDYAVNSGKGTIGYIEKLAVDWINNGVDTISAAEERISLLLAKKDAWRTVSGVFGFKSRNPSKKENELSYKWVYTYSFDKKVLKEAYDRTVDSLSEFNIKYVDKILENWHKAGLKTLTDILNYEEKETEQKGNNKPTEKSKENAKKIKTDKTYASYNKEKFKNKLSEDYN